MLTGLLVLKVGAAFNIVFSIFCMHHDKNSRAILFALYAIIFLLMILVKSI